MSITYPTSRRTAILVMSVTLLFIEMFHTSSIFVESKMVKMCPFYSAVAGHARSDPIISQSCASDHVHTFYGPQNFHPNTSYEDLRDTPPRFSTSPFIENQSLYWHPTIYQVLTNNDGSKSYIRAPQIETSPYYRWDNSVFPRTEAFPPGFRMIAHSSDSGANRGGELGFNMFTECCNLRMDEGEEEEDCQTWNELHFPSEKCDFLGIAFAMPTCWDGVSLGDDNNHKSHMAYTTNGAVNGPCPDGFNRRFPQVQLFVRVIDYQGGTYQLSDGQPIFHVDFFNGWKEGALQTMIDGCDPDYDYEDGDYNPPCSCTPEDGEGRFLTAKQDFRAEMCETDVRRLILDERIDTTNQLPRGSCNGPPLVTRSWTELTDAIFGCDYTSEPVADEDQGMEDMDGFDEGEDHDEDWDEHWDHDDEDSHWDEDDEDHDEDWDEHWDHDEEDSHWDEDENFDEDEDEQFEDPENGTMVKMCLFFESPSGHARSDPIINQSCPSDHVHTFYGPLNFHPNINYDDLKDTPGRLSTSPYLENQSLYWHPTIYQVVEQQDNTKTFVRAPTLEVSPYYRWDNSVRPRTEAFPPGFRMIAHSSDNGASVGDLEEMNLGTECCNMANGEEDCEEWAGLHFPQRTCDWLGIWFSMPTCWDGISLGDDNDHKSHMAYTTDGTVAGPCPDGFDHRFPQIQLFVRVIEYKGGTYQLSDSSDIFHVDFFNGWEEGSLQKIIDNCEPGEGGIYHPECTCTPEEGNNEFLTPNEEVASPICDADVRDLIVDEQIDNTPVLPRGTCQGPDLIPRFWDTLSDDLLDCQQSPNIFAPTDPPTAPLSLPTKSPSAAPPTNTSPPTANRSPTKSPSARPTGPLPTAAPTRTRSIFDLTLPPASPFATQVPRDTFSSANSLVGNTAVLLTVSMILSLF